VRDWLWDCLVYAGVAFGGMALWGCTPPGSRESSEALLVRRSSFRSTATADPPLHRLRARRRSKIAHECEAFLIGQSYELCPWEPRKSPPAWVWVNALAHGDCSELERLAALSITPRNPMGFLSYLAEEVLLAADHDEETLRRLQHQILVPLELALLGCDTKSSDQCRLARIIRHQLANPTRLLDAATPITLPS
jgi:hypothetical protein